MRNFAQFFAVFCLLLALTGCSNTTDAIHLNEDPNTNVIELSAGEELRQIQVELEPGSVKRFRISTDQFVAQLQQAGSTQARLSVKYYDLENSSETSVSPTVYALASTEAARNWTLRVHNEGDSVLDASISVRGLVRDTEVEVTPQLEALRSYDVSLAPGASTRRRVGAQNIVATFDNASDETRAKLRIKHYELEYEVETTHPVVQTASSISSNRNWTIILTNVSDTQLEGKLSVFDRDAYLAFHAEQPQSPEVEASVVFSPRSYHQSHLPRIIEALDAAEHTIDVAF